MIRARIDKPGGRPVVLLGIDRHNVERLKAGQPIRVAGKPLGLSADVAIAYGERLQDIVDELAHQGLDLPVAALDEARAIDDQLAGESGAS